MPPVPLPSTTIRGLTCSIAAAALLSGAATASPAGDVHHYEVTVDASMERLSVEAHFGSPVDTIAAKSRDAGKYLVEARDCGEGSPIRLRNRRMMLPYTGVRCMNYTVDLEAAARGTRHNRALAASNIIVSPALWLWRPAVTAASEIHIHFVLPSDMRVAVPWQPLGGKQHRFRLTGSPESAEAPAIFGQFDYSEIAVPGATLRVSLLRSEDGSGEMDTGSIKRWLRATATDVSLAYGRFPNPSPQVVVIPIVDGSGSGAVPFGRVIRNGGESVELFVNRRQSPANLFGDWTATHEFSHLMLPYVARRHRWVSEGFAQYYQNVLLARSGAYDSLTAWQKLYEGFERGRQSRPELSPNSATDRRNRGTRMKIYWSGAAIALMADVILRERSGGAETLDDIMGRLQHCCLPSDRAWSGTELFAKLDSLADEPVFMPLYRRYADTAGFPGTGALFGRLGLTIADDGRVRYSTGELEDIRGAIMKTDAGTALWRQRLARNRPAAGRHLGGNGGAR